MTQLAIVISLLILSISAAASARARASKTACGKIPTQGCCEGKTLVYCRRGRLTTLSCVKRPSCGWNEARGFYDCNTAGSADPAGKYSHACFFSDAGRPALPPARKPCGSLTEEGCCDGTRLRYCEAGRSRTIDCRKNLACGWRGVGQLYNCGTDGIPDPRGHFAKACPDGKPARGRESGPQRKQPRPKAGAASHATSGAKRNQSPGCATSASEPSLTALGLLLALLLRRNRSPRLPANGS